MAKRRRPTGREILAAMSEAMAVADGPVTVRADGVIRPPAPPRVPPMPWLTIRDAVEIVETEIATPPGRRWPHIQGVALAVVEGFNRDFARGLRDRLARSGGT